MGSRKHFSLASSPATLYFGIISALTSSHLIPVTAASNSSCAAPEGFSWKTIPPSRNLTWVECYTGRECARLEVPLDYSDPTGESAAIALLRIKANVSHDSEEYRGPILFNPGGPGGSGVSFINDTGETFQKRLGGAYDIVGFDPRGVGETTPTVSIFPDEIERTYWTQGSPPLLNTTVDALSQNFFRTKLFNKLVEDRSKKAAEHASTATTARDMLSITKAHGLMKIQYWGVSWGTVLGATYAAMFPDNIERLVLDGVVDFDGYISGLWTNSLLDTDKVLQFFYDECAKAGPACPLHANSSALVQKRVESIFATIKETPVSAINGSDYLLIDSSFLRARLFLNLYTPLALLPPFAAALVALESGDGGPMLELAKVVHQLPLPKCDTPAVLGSSKLEQKLATACGEAAHVANSTADIMEYFQNLSKISMLADAWTDGVYTVCAGWEIRAKERFAGPFTANTSFPILFIGNTLDPVTPLAGAQKAVKGFSGSALLTVNAPGHSSLAATMSPCVDQSVRNYFMNGTLPEEGKVCEIEDRFFPV